MPGAFYIYCFDYKKCSETIRRGLLNLKCWLKQKRCPAHIMYGKMILTFIDTVGWLTLLLLLLLSNHFPNSLFYYSQEFTQQFCHKLWPICHSGHVHYSWPVPHLLIAWVRTVGHWYPLGTGTIYDYGTKCGTWMTCLWCIMMCVHKWELILVHMEYIILSVFYQ